eukprot:m.255230 g.255230  ORF g.255230 m.255230 type:complete len:716 (+) comp19368_c0_seq1:127-2274(+)
MASSGVAPDVSQLYVEENDEALVNFLSTLITPMSRRPDDGYVLCSASASASILAYQQGTDIRRVPLERRALARDVFVEWLLSQDRQRRPLLCNVGTRGMGKSVLQAFNMMWFQKDKHGLAIEVTFNDDQGLGSYGFGAGACQSETEFSMAVALRILDHVFSSRLSSRDAGSAAVRRNLQRLCDLLSLKSPIKSAIAAALHFTNMPPDTPVLLAVDELCKAGERSPYGPSTMMRYLTDIADHTPLLYLAISAYTCSDVASFQIQSNHPIRLQPLTPLVPAIAGGLSLQQVASLPIALRALADETLRVGLPKTDAAKETLNIIPTLLQESGGHPRRVHALICELAVFEFQAHAPDEDLADWGGRFVTALQRWLHPPKLKALRDAMSEMETYDRTEVVKVDWDALTVFVARRFYFPSNKTQADECAVFLNTQQSGLCQFSPSAAILVRGHAFLPSPVLDALITCEPSGPRFRALQEVAVSVRNFSRSRPPAQQDPLRHVAGRFFERIVEKALVLFALCNDHFTLGQLCGREGTGGIWDDELLGGSTIKHITDVPCLPFDPHRHTGAPIDVSGLETLLQAPGWIAAPTNSSGVGSDVFCCFQRADRQGFVLLAINAKDHFVAHPKLVSTWHYGNRFFRDATVDHNCDHHLANGCPALLHRYNMIPVFMLFSANPIPAPPDLDPNECITDLVGMRDWQPSTAYAAECAHRLRQICRPADH